MFNNKTARSVPVASLRVVSLFRWLGLFGFGWPAFYIVRQQHALYCVGRRALPHSLHFPICGVAERGSACVYWRN